MQRQEIKKHNWLIVMAGVCLLLAVLFLLFTANNLSNNRYSNVQSFWFYILLALIIAPIIEEFLFRFPFLEKYKTIRIALLVLLLIFTVFNSFSIVSVTLYILFSVCVILKNIGFQKIKSSTLDVLMYSTGALLFGAIHYSHSDFFLIQTYELILFQISFGFIATWITINFGIVRSIFAHALWNLIAVSMVFYSIEFKPKKEKTIENATLEMKIKQESLFLQKSKYVIKPDSIIIENGSIITLLKILNRDKKINYYPKTQFIKYNITLNVKNNTDKIKVNEVEQLLIENDYIIQNK